MVERGRHADLRRMSTVAPKLDGGPLPHSLRLARLILLPSLPTPRERLDAALGPELAQFLVAALCITDHGRGSSSPETRTERKIPAAAAQPTTNETAPENPTEIPPSQM